MGTKLPLSSLGAGTYRLEVTASDSGKQVSRTAEFEAEMQVYALVLGKGAPKVKPPAPGGFPANSEATLNRNWP